MDCPCWLTLISDNILPKNIEPMHLWIFDLNTGDNLFRDTIYNLRQVMEFEIKRTDKLLICTVAGLSNNTLLYDDLSLNSNFTKKGDMSADSLYFYSNIISTAAEFATDTICLHKDYATVDISLKGAAYDNPVYLDLHCASSGRYVDGKYIAESSNITGVLPYKKDNGIMFYSCRINRQEDIADLKLSILTDISSKTYLIDDFPLGRYLIESGYNPTDSDMQDIEISFDVALSLITITIENWHKTIPVKIEL